MSGGLGMVARQLIKEGAKEGAKQAAKRGTKKAGRKVKRPTGSSEETIERAYGPGGGAQYF